MQQPAPETLRPFIIHGFIVLTSVLHLGCQRAEELPLEIQKQLESNNAPATSTEEEPGQEPSKPVEKVAEPCLVSDVEWISRDQLPWSYSEVQYVGSTRTGYSTVTVDRSELTELKQLRIRREDVIDRAIDGSPAAQRKVLLEIYEKANGELASFKFDSKIEGENDLLVEGRVVFNDLEVTKREGKGTPVRTKLPWIRQHWGPFGIQSALMRSPMKQGEIRTSQIFIPQMVRFVPVVFEAKSMELTPLAQGKSQELLQIDLTIGTPESGMLTSLFVDQRGVIQKTITRSGQTMLSMQVPLETVQRIADQSEFSRGISRRLEVSGDLSVLPQSSTARFLIDAEDQDPYDVLLRYERQQLKSINPNRCELTIVKPDSQSNYQLDERASDPALLESSVLIPAEKELISSIVAELLQGLSPSSEAEKAEALRTALHRVWTVQPIATEINSTLAAARDRTGSCIECSHLLAALLRNQKIPSRMVCGLRIDPATSQTQFHIWNQAWLDGRWIELDATIPGPLGALHIAMSTTAGSGQNPYSHYLTVLNTIAQFRSLQLIQGDGL